MTAETPGEQGEHAASVLGPEIDFLADPDVAGLGRSLALVLRGAMENPAAVNQAWHRYALQLAEIPALVPSNWRGTVATPPVALDPEDRRFADRAWSDNPAAYALRMYHQAFAEFVDQLVTAAGLERIQETKARLMTGLMMDTLAPANFLPANPAALKRAVETAGVSLVTGARNFADDLLASNGRPRQAGTSRFTLGKNLAATPAKVVYRDDLMELLQYSAQTPRVHSTPLLCSPPWINKYYLTDLAPGRSFIEWAVQHERTVFAISYRNPPAGMSGVTMDDYLIHGPRQALAVIQQITRADVVDMVGLCRGGALTAITGAYLSTTGRDGMGNLTLLNTLLDYSGPGVLEAFTDYEAVSRLEQKMAREGGLAGETMAGTFDILRANDLSSSYVVSSWLMGQDPPVFDILAWNADSTRMPAAMHSFCLRNFYLENRLAAGQLEVAGQVVKLNDVKRPTYIVGAENDHIVPWQSAYASTRLLSGPVRYVLSSGGHIAGIVNPPGPKGWYLVGKDHPESADEWREQATRHNGSWWEDWAIWSAANSGPLVDPPPTGNRKYRVLYDGPGDYVHT